MLKNIRLIIAIKSRPKEFDEKRKDENEQKDVSREPLLVEEVFDCRVEDTTVRCNRDSIKKMTQQLNN